MAMAWGAMQSGCAAAHEPVVDAASDTPFVDAGGVGADLGVGSSCGHWCERCCPGNTCTGPNLLCAGLGYCFAGAQCDAGPRPDQ